MTIKEKTLLMAQTMCGAEDVSDFCVIVRLFNK